MLASKYFISYTTILIYVIFQMKLAKSPIASIAHSLPLCSIDVCLLRFTKTVAIMKIFLTKFLFSRIYWVLQKFNATKICRHTVIKDKRKHHGAVDKRSLEQQFHKSDAITFIVWINWSPSHSGTRSYSRPSGRLLGRQKSCKVRSLNSVYQTFKMRIRHTE